MTDYISCDIAEFQPPVSDAYPHRWLSFRVCDGDYIDRNVGLNLSWALHAKATGRIDGFTVYVVYRPFKNSSVLGTLDRLGVPSDCVVMIDAETWGGQITGDHSAELNQLANALATRQKSQSRVWGYGNRGDLATLWSGRPAWLGVVVASYGGSKPSGIANLVGWQYTDGQYDVTGLPSASAPFGKCDHNVFYGIGDDMPLSDDDVKKVAAATRDAVWGAQIHSLDATGKPASGNHPASSWLTQATVNSAHAATGPVDANVLAQQIITALGADLAREVAAELGAALIAGSKA